MSEKSKEKKVRVVLYVPEGIHNFVTASMERIITAGGRKVKFTKSQNDAYQDFIKRGISSLENGEDEDDS